MSLGISRRLWALALVLASLSFLAASPAAAQKRRVAPPQISAFEMEPVDRLAPGAEMFFRLQGTAGGRATVRVPGVARTIVLQEVDDGTYEGAYSLRPADRVSPRSSVTGLLRKNNLSATSRIQFAAPAVAAAPAQPAPQPQAVPLAIQRFSANQVTKIEPGTELKFAVDGTPGQRASFTIEGAAAAVPMRETRPGHYEGSYTVKRLDRIGGVPIVAMLEGANGAWVKSELRSRQLLADARPPVVRNQQPRDGDVLPDAGPVIVSGTFDDHGGLGIDPATVKIVVGGRDVTAASTVTREFFTYRADLPAGNYAADVTAKDMAGNAVRSAWSFQVKPGTAQVVGVLPLEFTSHPPNAPVQSGRVQVRGHTAPGATVDVEVTGLAAVVGMIGVSQKVFSERLQADAAGNFAFEFTPQAFVPGTRYEIEAKASAGGQTRDARLVLFAQRG